MMETSKVMIAVASLCFSVTSAAACADWCQWVPTASQQYVAACETCQGQTKPVAAYGGLCASWCEWVPVPAQQYPADCTGCSQGSASQGAANLIASKIECSSFCRWVPTASWQYVSDCEFCRAPAERAAVAAGDRCASWCKWVPIPAQQYPADCTRCTTDANRSLVVDFEKLLEAKANVSDASGRNLHGCASFCQWVPTASQQYVAACETCQGQTKPVAAYGGLCASWCEWVPVPAQQYPADCTGCSQASASIASQGVANLIASKIECSSFCRWVPTASWQYVSDCEFCRAPAERAVVASGDRCASWCKWVPIPAQQYPADCTGCSNYADVPSEVEFQAFSNVMSNESDASGGVGKKSLRGSTTILP